MGFQYSCFCKTVQWFKLALALEPTARFVGKMEDDSVLHDARVVAELVAAHRLARRERKAAPLLWYGHFAWAVFYEGSGGRAKFCGDADDHLLSSFPRVCSRDARLGVMAPFASGGLDIRSRPFAELMAACGLLDEFLRGFDLANSSYGASCDGQQGYFVAKCLALPQAPAASSGPGAGAGAGAGLDRRSLDRTRVATALHLPWPKFHPPSRRHGARLHSSLLHPHRPCILPANPSPGGRGPGSNPSPGGRGPGSSQPIGRRLRGQMRGGGGGGGGGGQLQNLCEDPVPRSWRWNVGQGMLPLRFRLHGEWRNGLATMWWEPLNRSHVRAYHRLHAHKEDDRYCDALPCGLATLPERSPHGRGGARVAAAAAAVTAAAAAVPAAAAADDDANAPRPTNVSACATMLSCFAGEGGTYWYQGEGPRRHLVPWT